MKKFIFILLLFLGVAVVALSFGELENIVATLQQARFRYILLALVLEALWLWNLGFTYKAIYHLLGIEEDRNRLTLVAAASNFVNIVAPVAGMSGITVFAAEAKSRNYPPGKATLAGALFVLFDQTAFLVVLAVGWIVLLRRDNVHATDIVASLVLLVVASLLASLLYLGYRSATRLGNALARIAHQVNRILHPFLRRDYLNEAHAHVFAAEMAEGLGDLPERPKQLLVPLLYCLLNKVILMSILICSFLAFDVPFSAGTIIAGWALGYLFVVVSPTPNGIGIVEGIMPLALTSLRVPVEAAVVITLTYRGLTFWVTVAVSAWSFRKLHFEES